MALVDEEVLMLVLLVSCCHSLGTLGSYRID